MNAGEFARRRARIEHEEHRRGKGYGRKALAALMREAGAEAVMKGSRLIGWALPNLQIACRKERHSSEESAALALAGATAATHERKRPVRYYCCDYCGAWHLTSQK